MLSLSNLPHPILSLQWSELLTEITKRPYIIVGAIAFVLLVPLAVTSTRGWQRRLGRRPDCRRRESSAL